MSSTNFDFVIDKEILRKIDNIKDINNILCSNSSEKNTDIIIAILYKHGKYPYKCCVCQNCGLWNRKPLKLILSHKNGVENDMRISNLELKCPNCYYQSNANIFFDIVRKSIRKCKFCGVGLKATVKGNICGGCYYKVIDLSDNTDISTYIETGLINNIYHPDKINNDNYNIINSAEYITNLKNNIDNINNNNNTLITNNIKSKQVKQKYKRAATIHKDNITKCELNILPANVSNSDLEKIIDAEYN